MRTYVEVVGRGAATQPPDRLDLHVGVNVVRPTVGEAIAHLGGQVARLGEVARGLGLADTDLRSTHNHVGEEYAGTERTHAGYRAEQGLTLRIRDLDAVSAVVEAVVDAIGDDFRMHNLVWAVSDETSLAARAREAAFQDAHDKASQLAALAGRTLGKLQRLRETEGFGGGPVRLAEAASAPAFVPERGESEVSVSLTARWSLD